MSFVLNDVMMLKLIGKQQKSELRKLKRNKLQTKIAMSFPMFDHYQ
jgi:hypothetical protein